LGFPPVVYIRLQIVKNISAVPTGDSLYGDDQSGVR